MNGKKYSKRQYNSKKRSNPKKETSKAFARKVRAVIQKVAETRSSITVGTEVTSSSLTSPTTSNAIVLNSVPLGTAIANRVGNVIQPKYIDLRGSVHMAPSDSTTTARMLVIEHNVTDDPLSTLLETNTGDFGPPAQDFSSMFSRINTTKYRVLATKVIKLGNANGYFNTQMFHFNIKLSGKMFFEIGDNVPDKRQITFIWWNRRTDNDEGLGTSMECTYNSKFYYQDI